MCAFKTPLAPHVGAVAHAPQLDSAVGDAELRIDLQGTGVNSHRPRLLGGAAVTIDDDGLNAASAELVGEHQSGWTGSHDEDVDVGNHVQLLHAAA